MRKGCDIAAGSVQVSQPPNSFLLPMPILYVREADGYAEITHRFQTSLSTDDFLELYEDLAATTQRLYQNAALRAEDERQLVPWSLISPQVAAPEHEQQVYDDDGELLRWRGLAHTEPEATAEDCEDREARMLETRALIRSHPQLTKNAKTVLLLVTQIPRGRWTDYETLQEHINESKTRLELNFLSKSGIGMARCLEECPFANADVPCHRVIGERCFDGRGFAWLGSHRHNAGLLQDEGVRFDGALNPYGRPFDDFRGCPRL